MAFNTPLTDTQKYVFGRGVCYFAEFDADGVPMGERDLGNVPGFELEVESEIAEHFSSRSGIAKKDDTATVSVGFNANLTFDSFSNENMALFLGGTSGIFSQAAATVTDHELPNFRSGRQYQLGVSASVITGVRNVTGVAVRAKQVADASARVNSQAYTLGQIFTSGGNAYIVSTAGTTAGSPPTYDTAAIGNDTTDGTAVVLLLGATGVYALTTSYLLSAEAARIGVVVGGPLALGSQVHFDVTGDYFIGEVDYTVVAETRNQVSSAATGAVSGQFRFIADNAKGDNRDVFIASVSLAPSGALPFITAGGDYAEASFALGVNERDTSTPQILIDGRTI